MKAEQLAVGPRLVQQRAVAGLAAAPGADEEKGLPVFHSVPDYTLYSEVSTLAGRFAEWKTSIENLLE